jgi:two-component system chemotaxis response regulator CheY
MTHGPTKSQEKINDRGSPVEHPLGTTELETLLSQMSFLIVDDVPGTCTLLRELIQGLGARSERISTCPSVFLAKQRLSTAPVDIIISDLHLKDGKGVELLRNLRSHPKRSDSVFLLMTGDPTSALINESVALGVSSVVVKPVTFLNLKEHLQFSFKRLLTFTASQPHGKQQKVR